MSSNPKRLQDHIIEWIGKSSFYPTVKKSIPEVITSNLNPNFVLREYQKRAFCLFDSYWKDDLDGSIQKTNNILFHMATGSGKTLIMAGLILYLYEKGYRNFLFFVDRTNIVEKTKDNFLNSISQKYLFSQKINIGVKQVQVNQVDNFQYTDQNAINIVFTTTNSLHNSLREPRENEITLEDFEDTKVVLISDEAHHINADTKRGKQQTENLFQNEDSKTWEESVARIFKSNPENLLLEFSATIDFSNSNIAEKYFSKTLFDYPLKNFREDKFSKEIRVIYGDIAPMERALYAVLISQYRKKLFGKYHLRSKPVILFKSRYKADNARFYSEFQEYIKSLQEEDLERIEISCTNSTLKRFFAFLKENNISFEDLIEELREDFSSDKLMIVDSNQTNDNKETQIALNRLEDNQFRAIFAVDKLNEGWDVLNLFDIVRMNDMACAKLGSIKPTTTAEAQLIGRGARYCPFQISEGQPKYERKYDNDLTDELRLCEELIYYSPYNPQYIEELKQALIQAGSQPDKVKECKIDIKDGFKKTNFYRSGVIFLNKRVQKTLKVVEKSNRSLLKNHSFRYNLSSDSTSEAIIFDEKEFKSSYKIKQKILRVSKQNKHLVRDAINDNPFYRFDNLKKYFPDLKSISSFISDDAYLGDIDIIVSGTEEATSNLSPKVLKALFVEFLKKASSNLTSHQLSFAGSNTFEPQAIKEKMQTKVLEINTENTLGKEQASSMKKKDSQDDLYLNTDNKDWLPQTDYFGTPEEKYLVRFIDSKYEELEKFYSDIFLVRNESYWKIYNFSDGAGFEPDFVLFMKDKKTEEPANYQIFIESKGVGFAAKDHWKEELLKEINKEHSLIRLNESKNYIIWGLPFYQNQNQATFNSAFDDKFLSAKP